MESPETKRLLIKLNDCLLGLRYLCYLTCIYMYDVSAKSLVKAALEEPSWNNELSYDM